MKAQRRIRAVVALVLGCTLLSGDVLAEERDAAEIVAEIRELESRRPAFDQKKSRNRVYLDTYRRQTEEVDAGISPLARELYEVAPGHEVLPLAWRARLRYQAWFQGKFKVARKEAEAVLAAQPVPALESEALFWRVEAMLMEMHRGNHETAPFETAELLRAGEDLWGEYPRHDGVPRVLVSLSDLFPPGSEEQLGLLRKLIELQPQSPEAREHGPKLRVLEGLGKPFELEFEDLVSGRAVSVAKLRGKVVVIDFWATWCGPCVAEMPRMKKLFAAYEDKGVAFIGVSLDDRPERGGREKLLRYVEKNKIPWPQYYQGDGWSSAFSSSWGISAIPALFVVDAEGKLYDIEARGRLELVLDTLIAARDAAQKD